MKTKHVKLHKFDSVESAYAAYMQILRLICVLNPYSVRTESGARTVIQNTLLYYPGYDEDLLFRCLHGNMTTGDLIMECKKFVKK